MTGLFLFNINRIQEPISNDLRGKRGGKISGIKYGTLLFLLILIVTAAHAEEERWGIGVMGGLYRPSLRTLNQVLHDSQSAVLQDPNHQLQPNVAFTPEIRNLTVPSFEIDRAFGVEVRRHIDLRNALLVTLSIWDGERTANDIAPQLTAANQATFLQVPRSSRYQISISQLWLGWRHYFPALFEKGRLHLDIGLIGASYGQMTIDTLLRVTDPIALQNPSFAVVSSLEADGWGLTTRWGVGGEYLVKKWLAFSFRVGYIMGKIPKLRVHRFFPSGFSSPPVPEAGTDLQPRPESGEAVTFGDVRRGSDPNQEIRSNVRVLPLELDGFEAMAGIHFYF